MMPDFPMPVTTTRPRQLETRSTARSKLSSRRSISFLMESASISRTRRAISRVIVYCALGSSPRALPSLVYQGAGAPPPALPPRDSLRSPCARAHGCARGGRPDGLTPAVRAEGSNRFLPAGLAPLAFPRVLSGADCHYSTSSLFVVGDCPLDGDE